MVLLGTLLLASAFSPGAEASPAYPAVVSSATGLPCDPACTLCHLDIGGGLGTVVQPFGETLYERGLGPGSSGELRDLLIEMELDGADSDLDGTSDMAELRDAENPNGTTATGVCDNLPVYGCAMRPTVVVEPDLAAVALLMAAIAARARRQWKETS